MSEGNKSLTQRQYLTSRGWHLISRKKQGCFLIVRWSLPNSDWQNVSQSCAYRVAKDSEKWRKEHPAQ